MSRPTQTLFTGLTVLLPICTLVLGSLLSSAANAQQQQALFYSHDDPRLEWSPCPDFFPEGCAIAVLQGDPTQPNADIFFKVPANAQLAGHWHTSAERMVLVSGQLHLSYEEQDSRTIQPGTYIYGPAKLPHQGHCGDGDPCILFIAFEQPIDAMLSEDH